MNKLYELSKQRANGLLSYSEFRTQRRKLLIEDYDLAPSKTVAPVQASSSEIKAKSPTRSVQSQQTQKNVNKTDVKPPFNVAKITGAGVVAVVALVLIFQLFSSDEEIPQSIEQEPTVTESSVSVADVQVTLTDIFKETVETSQYSLQSAEDFMTFWRFRSEAEREELLTYIDDKVFDLEVEDPALSEALFAVKSYLLESENALIAESKKIMSGQLSNDNFSALENEWNSASEQSRRVFTGFIVDQYTANLDDFENEDTLYIIQEILNHLDLFSIVLNEEQPSLIALNPAPANTSVNAEVESVGGNNGVIATDVPLSTPTTIQPEANVDDSSQNEIAAAAGDSATNQQAQTVSANETPTSTDESQEPANQDTVTVAATAVTDSSDTNEDNAANGQEREVVREVASSVIAQANAEVEALEREVIELMNNESLLSLETVSEMNTKFRALRVAKITSLSELGSDAQRQQTKDYLDAILDNHPNYEKHFADVTEQYAEITSGNQTIDDISEFVKYRDQLKALQSIFKTFGKLKF